MSFKYLDVSDLPAPEPMEKILELLSSSSNDEIICMIHRQKPLNLFKILNDRSYCYRLVEVENTHFSKGYKVFIYIWNHENTTAAIAVEKAIESV